MNRPLVKLGLSYGVSEIENQRRNIFTLYELKIKEYVFNQFLSKECNSS